MVDMCVEIDQSIDSINVFDFEDKKITLNFVHLGKKSSKIQKYTAFTLEEHIVQHRNLNMELKDNIIRNFAPITIEGLEGYMEIYIKDGNIFFSFYMFELNNDTGKFLA